MNVVDNLLFSTGAIKVAPADNLFWYTSGKLGPFYINTHYLFGSEKEAADLLTTIDSVSDDREKLTYFLDKIFTVQYESNKVYKATIDSLLKVIKTLPSEEFNYISGGERRDWFFSVICANILELPHLTLYKDQTAAIAHNGNHYELSRVSSQKMRCLHIADLITEASSYERAWVPAVKGLGGSIVSTVAVVNRNQGGFEVLERLGIEPHALTNIDGALFAAACERGIINESQKKLIMAYIDSPDSAVKEFLDEHPDYVKKTIAAAGKDSERAKICIEKGFYK